MVTKSASVATSESSASTGTPVHVVPSLDHLVTQWMSTVKVSCGSARNSSHVQRAAASTAPSTVKVQSAVLILGVGPADSTGKSSTTYCPGGTREGSTSGRRRPLNPRETCPMRRPYRACKALRHVRPDGEGGGHHRRQPGPRPRDRLRLRSPRRDRRGRQSQGGCLGRRRRGDHRRDGAGGARRRLPRRRM